LQGAHTPKNGKTPDKNCTFGSKISKRRKMKNARAVYQKLREVKYFHVVDLYKKYTRRIPENCRYNYPYIITGEYEIPIEIRLCLLHQPNLDLKTKVIPHLVDVCQEPKHCVNCNGFVARYQKEDIKRLFEEELKNRDLKEKRYPDICALEWVLDQSTIGIPVLGWAQRLYYLVKRWLSKNKIL
jgi:hypothetical protein